MNEETNVPGGAEADPAVEADPIGYALPSTPRGIDAGLSAGVTRIDLATIAVRLIGIYYLVVGGQLVVYWLFALTTDSRVFRHAGFISTLLHSLLQLVPGLLLLLFGENIARWVLPPHDDTHSARKTFLGMTGPELQSTAYAIIGVFLVIEASRPLIYATIQYMRFGQFIGPDNFERTSFNGLASGIELAVGISLFLGSRKIAQLWKQLRGKYRDEKQQPANAENELSD